MVGLLVALYLFPGNNRTAELMFGYVVIAYVIGVHLLVSVSAFQDGIGLGFLTLCLPLFAIYYVYKINDNQTLRILYGFVVLVRILTWLGL
jgi:hypothetical protein